MNPTYLALITSGPDLFLALRGLEIKDILGYSRFSRKCGNPDITKIFYTSFKIFPQTVQKERQNNDTLLSHISSSNYKIYFFSKKISVFIKILGFLGIH